MALPGTGLSVAALDERTRARFNVPAETQGLLVVEVEDGSAAEGHGIRRGDVIVSIALQSVRDSDEALKQLEALREQDNPVATLMVERHGVPRFVALRLAQV